MRAGRPFGIVALAVLSAAGGIWVLTGAAGLRPGDTYTIGDVVIGDNIARLIAAGWGSMLLASAVLIAVAHRWGWALLMVSTGIGLLVALWQWWLGNLEPIRMAILVVTAFFLNGREVRDLLLQPTHQATVVPLLPPEGGRR